MGRRIRKQKKGGEAETEAKKLVKIRDKSREGREKRRVEKRREEKFEMKERV